ncbi:amino acid ABC transporter permease [Cohnella thailandensis]|uniref:Amino acid ABC transporter permease n=1 Tax=Cohnella thailandensis TaxID=557557 RepID=A0A841SWU2_9BACL|nr:amino acid ABC transporter permease [Cohnella thailandensis]MBB6636384.1 amino acid ABC transporter permease [Cohnella thailandensis]MBP1973646.1 polar amino acid transport system permease protein [Cohnella thailandensis]
MSGFQELITNVGHYLASHSFLVGALNTIKLTLAAQAVAVVLGFVVALAKMSRWKALSGLASSYIWVFRGIPVLVQLIFVFNALPQFGIKLTGFQSALVALALNEAAYMAEIVRSGLASVGKGQHRAGRALGMNSWQRMRHIVLPQAFRVILPPTANQFIGMLKTSAMASVVGYTDLLMTAQQTASANFNYVDTLVAAVIYYLAFTAIFTLLQTYLERKLDISRKAKRSPIRLWKRRSRETHNAA